MAAQAGPEGAEVLDGVVYYLDESVPAKIASQLKEVLRRGGAQPACPHRAGSSAVISGQPSCRPRFDTSTTTHVITDSLDLPEYRLLGSWSGTQGSVLTVDGAVTVDSQERIIYLVTPLWLTRSHDLQKRQPEKAFSPDLTRFLSGVVVCCEGLLDGDVEMIAASALAYGGQWRHNLTRDCTHLICMEEGGQMYETAMKYKDDIHIQVVTPHWFHYSVLLRSVVLSAPFLFPLPPIFSNPPLDDDDLRNGFLSHPGTKLKYRAVETYPRLPTPSNQTITDMLLGPNPHRRLNDEGQEAYLKLSEKDMNRVLEGSASATSKGAGRSKFGDRTTAGISDSMSTSRSNETTARPVRAAKDRPQIFAGRKVYLASTLALSPIARTALADRVVEAGGICGSGPEAAESQDESMELDEQEAAAALKAEDSIRVADFVICDFRYGWEYWLARDQKATIGTLQWLVGALDADRVRAPTDRLLDFPCPREPAFASSGVAKAGRLGGGWNDEVATLTNYNGPTRSYLVKMIERLGGTHDGKLDVNMTTLLVAANKAGLKAAAAMRNNIQIVNHTFVEDCFATWSRLPISDDHIAFPPGINHLDSVGERGLHPAMLEKWEALPEVKRRREAEVLETPSIKLKERQDQLARFAVMKGAASGNNLSEDEDDNIDIPPQASLPYETSNAVAAMDIADEDLHEDTVSPVRPATKAPRRPRDSNMPPPPTANSVTMDMDIDNQSDAEPGPSAAQVEGDLLPDRSVTLSSAQKSILTRESKGPASSRKARASSTAVPSTDRIGPTKAQVAAVPDKKGKSKTVGLNVNVEPEEVLVSAHSPPPPLTSAARVNTESPAAAQTAGRASRRAAQAASRKVASAAEDMNAFAKERKRKRPSIDGHEVISIDASSVASLDRTKKGKGKASTSVAEPPSRPAPPPEGSPDTLPSVDEIIARSPPKKAKVASGPAKSGKGGQAVPAIAKHKRVQEFVEQVKTTPQVASFDAPPGQAKSAKPAESAVIAAGQQAVVLQTGGERLNQKLQANLERLGVKFTDNPKEHTHLVTDKISRTEKFILSVVRGVFVVSRKWAEESAKMGTLLAESQFSVKDVKGEKERGFTLVKSLDRAKEQNLLQGHTFYLSPRITPDVEIIKRIIEAAGGKAETKAPLVKTARLPKVHIITCLDDKRWWNPLTRIDEEEGEQPIPFYYADLITEGLLRQEIQWDKYRVDVRGV